MKNKIKKIILLLILIFSFGGLIYVIESLHGSMIIKGLTTIKAKAYVSENYPGEAYEVSYCRYDFKALGYYCNVYSMESKDKHFIVYKGKDGFYDDYEECIENRWNTRLRLSQELNAYAEDLYARIYPHKTDFIFCDYAENVLEEDYKDLELDMPLDAKHFPLPIELILWVETSFKQPSWEELEEMFLELEAITREELPCVSYYSIQLQNPYEYVEGDWIPGNYNSEVYAYRVPAKIIQSGEIHKYLMKERLNKVFMPKEAGQDKIE